MSSSPFQGCWKLYGRENAELMACSLKLPKQFICAMKQVKICESIHVNGENVHVNICVPEYTVPAHGKDINFAFGVECTQSLPFGSTGKGTVQKESDVKWVAKLTHEQGACTITRELRNGEMWVTIESSKGVKTIRKFERCPQSCQGPCSSPFQGTWRLYGSEGFEAFMEAIGVPPHWQCIFANMTITEHIHVNGNDAHIKICIPEVTIPCHSHEFSFKFGEPHEFKLPFGHHATAVGKKESETKWSGKLTNCEKLGDVPFTREIVNDEMWVTLDVQGKKIVHKFEKFTGQCPTQKPASCK